VSSYYEGMIIVQDHVRGTAMWSTSKHEYLSAFVCVHMRVPRMCNYYELTLLVLYVDAPGFLQRRFGRRTGFSLSKGLSRLMDETSRASTDVSAVYSLIFSHFWSFEKDVSR